MRVYSCFLAVVTTSFTMAQDTDPICLGFRAPYDAAVAKCEAALRVRPGPPVGLTSQLEFCKVPECKAAIDASLQWKAQAAAVSTCKPLGVQVWPGLWCASAVAQQESYCHACEAMFPLHKSMNEMCAFNSATPTSYISANLNNFAAAMTFCRTTFKNIVFNYPTDPNVILASTSTTTYIGIGAGVLVLVLIVVGVVIYRRRQQAGKSTPATSGSGGYYSNNGTPTHGSGTYKGTTTHGGSVANDIRFDPDLARFRIPQEHIQNVTLLVKGGYGVVFRATCHGEDVAMKQLLPSKAKDQHAIQEFMNEIRLCARLEHPKIVRFVGISWSTLHDLAVLSEFMANGDVTDLLKAERKRSPKDRVFLWDPRHNNFGTSKTAVAADVADALCFLHSFMPTIIRRDLKSKNVLMGANWDAKLSDFGISRVASNDNTMTSNIGTVAWIAPEVLTGGHYSEKADIYSFGVFLSELDTLESPYAEMTEKNAGGFSNARIAMMVSEGALQPTFTDVVPSPILDLAQKCLSFRDVNRPTARDVAATLRALCKV
ncbi:hypothetical protein DYB34_012260 [Aphanomyces astaci]|uniref:Protein kinase domain-containing protein n=1 Tax=Aphanomyces astaci TaxID=112090 RepID=A0A3R7DLV3_APHAT|nr:hypothetical protein DYB34_012260 [Aphanomyces astaci]